jgi:hypothetical protein
MNQTPTIGAIVVTADGDELGRIKEFEGDCFKLDVPLEPDYWLAADTVDTTTSNTVLLLVRRAELARTIRPSAEHSGYHMHQ